MASLAPPALACSVIVDHHRTSLWERVWDWSPPVAAPVPALQIWRGQGPRATREPGVFTSTSCDDIGSITLTFPPTADASVGYAFEIVAGRTPDLFQLPEPLRLARRNDGAYGLTLWWSDGAVDEQEPFSFVLGIRTVDRAGNRSREVTRVLVRDPGRAG